MMLMAIAGRSISGGVVVGVSWLGYWWVRVVGDGVGAGSHWRYLALSGTVM